MYVVSVHQNLIICVDQVYLSTNDGIDEEFQDLVLTRKRSVILYSSLIEFPVVMNDTRVSSWDLLGGQKGDSRDV